MHRTAAGALAALVENRGDRRVLPSVWIAGDTLHHLLGKRRPFLTAKRLLSNQTFRDIYRTDTLDIDQRLRITSLTFLFTDLKGSTALYERVGDVAAYDLVRAHFDLLQSIVAAGAGAVVKTIGDAVMATFPTPDRALAAALRMRDAMQHLNAQRGGDDLLLKIGIHQGPCLAVTARTTSARPSTSPLGSRTLPCPRRSSRPAPWSKTRPRRAFSRGAASFPQPSKRRCAASPPR